MSKKIPNQARLTKDFNELLKTIRDTKDNKDGSISCDGNYEDSINGSLKNMKDFTVLLRGPDETPYSGGMFKLRFQVLSEYPFDPPTVTFVTKIYHPNINEKGDICLNTLRSAWTPVFNFTKLIMSISALLADPNPDDPLRAEIGSLCKSDILKFKSNAIEHTKKNAIPDENRKYMIY